MSRYQADTFQCALLINIQPLTIVSVVAGNLLATSFFISCVKCLWDSVGYFLGRRKAWSEPPLIRAPRLIDRMQGLRSLRCTQMST